MKLCRECGGSGQDPDHSPANCLSCDGMGYIPDYRTNDIPAIAIVDVIEALEDYAAKGTIEQSRGRCGAIAAELQEWFNEA